MINVDVVFQENVRVVEFAAVIFNFILFQLKIIRRYFFKFGSKKMTLLNWIFKLFLSSLQALIIVAVVVFVVVFPSVVEEL